MSALRPTADSTLAAIATEPEYDQQQQTADSRSERVAPVVAGNRPYRVHRVLQSLSNAEPTVERTHDSDDHRHRAATELIGLPELVVGIVGALYGGLGVGQALQNAMDSVWAVPRNNRRDPFRSRVRSLLLLVILGSVAIAASVLSAVGRSADTFGMFGKAGIVLAAVAINAAIGLVAFRVTTARDVSYLQVLPGALAAAVIWQLLQWFGAGYVAHTVKSASATNSVFALVLGLLAFLYLASASLVLCAEVNVVRVDRLYPRALLTPFTDDVELTSADRQTYTRKAKAERLKGFQHVDVTFDSTEKPPPQD